MDTKERIDARLTALGKDRQWLADQTGYSYFSVRDSLAPAGRPLSKRMERAFCEALEALEQVTQLAPSLPDRVTLEVTSAEYDAYSEAALAQKQTLKRWAVEELNKAAEAFKRSSAYENHEEWIAKQEVLRVAEEPEPGKSYRSGQG